MFPKINIASCGCGSGKAQSACGCNDAQSQVTIPMQKLPKAKLPATQPNIPKDYKSLLHTVWSGSAVDFGIQPGDTGTEVILKLIAAIKRLSGIDAAVYQVTLPDGVQTGNVIIDLERLGLDQLDNTSDFDKDISNLTQQALDKKASLDEPVAFTKKVTVPTPTLTQIDSVVVNRAWVKSFIDLLKQTGYLVGGVQGGTITSVNGQLPDVDGSLLLLAGHLGLDEVNNTSDADKPASDAVLELFAELGIRVVDSVADLGDLNGEAQTLVLVQGVGFFRYDESAAPNGVTVFSTNANGTWNLMQFAPAETALVDDTVIAVDASRGGFRKITIDGTRTMGLPTGIFPNRTRLVFEITQGEGSTEESAFDMEWHENYRFSQSLPQPTLSGGAGTTDRIEFEYNAASSLWYCVAWYRDF
jgi:hypothetical protein